MVIGYELTFLFNVQSLASEVAEIKSMLFTSLQTMQSEIQTLKSGVYRKHHKKAA